MSQYLYYLGFVPQIVALIHYFRNRPEGYWFWIIIFFGPIGPIIYFFAVVISSEGSVDIQGKFKAGLKERKRVRQLELKANSGEALPYDLHELGELLFKFGRYQQAVDVLTQAVSQAPENPDGRFYLGLSLEKLNRFEHAGRILEPIIMHDPKFKFGEAMHALARCYKGAKEDQAAIMAYKKVLSQSSFAQARYELSEIYVRMGQQNQARQELERLIKDAKTSELDLPSFQRRVERKWARKARTLLTSLQIKTVGKKN